MSDSNNNGNSSTPPAAADSQPLDNSENNTVSVNAENTEQQTVVEDTGGNASQPFHVSITGTLNGKASFNAPITVREAVEKATNRSAKGLGFKIDNKVVYGNAMISQDVQLVTHTRVAGA